QRGGDQHEGQRGGARAQQGQQRELERAREDEQRGRHGQGHAHDGAGGGAIEGAEDENGGGRGQRGRQDGAGGHWRGSIMPEGRGRGQSSPPRVAGRPRSLAGRRERSGGH